jgi:hypothetical protein
MERDVLLGTMKNMPPLEIDIRKILEQLGIQREIWPEEYQKPVEQS